MTDMEGRDTGAAAQEKRAEVPEQAQREETAAETRERTEARPAATTREERRPAGAEAWPTGAAGVGWLVYAGVVLIVVGLFEAIWGLTGLFRTAYFVSPATGLVVAYNYTVWAWVHIALAVLLVLTGLAVLAGQRWARYVGICLASLGMIANFLTLAALPFWSLVMIAIDVLVIYALAVHGRDMERLRTSRT